MIFVPIEREISTDYATGERRVVKMHDGSSVTFRKLEADYDPTDRERAYARVREAQQKGEVVTGLLYIDDTAPDMHAMNNTARTPLTQVPYEKLCPGSAALDELMQEYR